jgi:Fur family ferric uptake transcriptional regulator
MVNAGVARKVDFGEGRSRFEPAYRHPRHFHLVCNICHRSSEFLSSDIEALVEEIALARKFEADHTVLQVFGTCDECRTGAKTRRWMVARQSWCLHGTRCGSRLPRNEAGSSSTHAPRA